MKKVYIVIIVLFALCLPAAKSFGQVMGAYPVKGPIPKSVAQHRIGSGITAAYLNYMQSDSIYFPLGYFTNYMFEMNSRYTLADTGIPLSNQLLIQSFGVLFDSLLDIRGVAKDTGYAPGIIKYITIDSIHAIIGHSDSSLGQNRQDTIIVQIDSIDAYSGYITSTVLRSDTIFTGDTSKTHMTGLSPGNNWLKPINIVVKPNYPSGFLVNSNKFAVTISYYGSKRDTFGFLPGFPYKTCLAGGSGPIPEGTQIGENFGTLKANSLTSGYKYFFNNDDTIPGISGSTGGLYLRCSNPSSKYWYFQDNPISAYIHFQDVTGANEFSENGFSVSQNYPNPFNKKTQITYSLTKSSKVEFAVYDLAGRQLVNNQYSIVAPGQHTINLEANQFSPGIYLYTFNVNGTAVTKKMVISQ
jgi:hypothetical protein